MDENTGTENFLRNAFNLSPDSKYCEPEKNRFLNACKIIDNVVTETRRTQDRNKEAVVKMNLKGFKNEADTDWTLSENRKWGAKLLNNNYLIKGIVITLD